MVNNTQYIIALIDRSGSMSGKEEDTIGGINTMLHELKNDKKDKEEIFVTIKLFDHELITLIENIKINDVALLKCSDFKPRGQTALVDSLGLTLQEVISKKRRNILFYNSCLIYVCTDGLENASNSFTKEDVKKLIKDASEEQVNVLYLGANQDSFLEAQTLGINLEGVMNYHECSDTVRSAFASVAQAATRTRSLGVEPSFTKAERESSQSISQSISQPINARPPLLRRQTDIALSTIPPQIKKTKSYA